MRSIGTVDVLDIVVSVGVGVALLLVLEFAHRQSLARRHKKIRRASSFCRRGNTYSIQEKYKKAAVHRR